MRINYNKNLSLAFSIFLIINLIMHSIASLFLGPDIPIVVTQDEFTSFLFFSIWVVILTFGYIAYEKKSQNIWSVLSLTICCFLYWNVELFFNTLSYNRPAILVNSILVGYLAQTLSLTSISVKAFIIHKSNRSNSI